MGFYVDGFGKVILKEKLIEADLTKIREVFYGITVEGNGHLALKSGTYQN